MATAQSLATVHTRLASVSSSFSLDRWLELWPTLPDSTRDEVVARARRRQATLGEVARDAHPEVWRRVALVPLFDEREQLVAHFDSDGAIRGLSESATGDHLYVRIDGQLVPLEADILAEAA